MSPLDIYPCRLYSDTLGPTLLPANQPIYWFRADPKVGFDSGLNSAILGYISIGCTRYWPYYTVGSVNQPNDSYPLSNPAAPKIPNPGAADATWT